MEKAILRIDQYSQQCSTAVSMVAIDYQETAPKYESLHALHSPSLNRENDSPPLSYSFYYLHILVTVLTHTTYHNTYEI